MQTRRQEKGPAVVTCRENLSWCPSEILWGLDGEMPGMIVGHQLAFFTQAWLAEEITEYNVLQLSHGVLQKQIPEPGSEGSPLLMFAEILYLSKFLQVFQLSNTNTNSAIFVFLKICKLTLKGYFNWLPALWKYERQRFCSGLPLTFLNSFYTLCYSSVQRSTMGSSAVKTCCTLSSLVHLILMPQQCLE